MFASRQSCWSSRSGVPGSPAAPGPRVAPTRGPQSSAPVQRVTAGETRLSKWVPRPRPRICDSGWSFVTTRQVEISYRATGVRHVNTGSTSPVRARTRVDRWSRPPPGRNGSGRRCRTRPWRTLRTHFKRSALLGRSGGRGVTTAGPRRPRRPGPRRPDGGARRHAVALAASVATATMTQGTSAVSPDGDKHYVKGQWSRQGHDRTKECWRKDHDGAGQRRAMVPTPLTATDLIDRTRQH